VRALVPALIALALGCQEPAQGNQPPKPSEGARTLKVSSDPAGAAVSVGGFARGQTPVELKLDPGSYKVVVHKAGYLRYETEVTVRFGSDAEVSTSLLKTH
jgi:hypothetical protein